MVHNVSVAILAQGRVGSRPFLPFIPSLFALPGVMPLSKEQMDLLKDGNTPIQCAKDNPKKIGSKARDRYEQSKDATSIAQATEKKTGWQDLTADFEKGFLKITKDIDGEGQGSTKRPAPEGTPDRETQARTKTHASEMIPRSLPTELQDPTSKVEMSAATIVALRMVAREEIDFDFALLLHACRQPIKGAGCETNTIAQSSKNQSAKIVEIVLPQVGGLSRPHPIFKINVATGQNVVMVNPKS